MYLRGHGAPERFPSDLVRQRNWETAEVRYEEIWHRASGEMCGLTVTPPTPLFFVSVDGGVEIICFDRLLQVLILRELLVDDNLQR
jgi:hypothetical protein